MKNLLFVILITAFLLRFWGIWNLDIFGDASAYAFRSIGYIDYLGTSFQTQPIDWYQNSPLPSWTKLSFHDHPPLVFIIQNLFFRIFGDSLISARLPGITFGTASVFFIFLLVKKFLAGETLALLASFLFAVNLAMVWISRSALMEPIFIFLVLVNIYLFFRFLEDQKFWLYFGITLGLIALTKYIGVFLIPVYFSYLFFGLIHPINRISPISTKVILRSWRFYAAFLIALLVFSPVIIYNFYLYQVRGHFDLQIAYFLGQDTPEWTGLLGKIQSPFTDIGKNLPGLYGWPMLIMALFGLSYWTYKTYWTYKPHYFFFFYLFFSTLLFMKIGVADRFIALYGPIFVILAAIAAGQFWKGYFGKLAVIVFLIWEVVFSINKNLINLPDYGIAKLDNYFEQEFQNKESAVIPESDNVNLNGIIRKFAARETQNPPFLFLIVYNDNIALSTLQWIFYRRFFYHGMPVMYVENFEKILSDYGLDYFGGFDIYFVQSTENTLLNPFKTQKTAGLALENNLLTSGLRPAKIISGHDDLEMFRVYKFNF
ncbi:MAG: glycosyltransferase family 39 protein [Candidatus Harrisonbacteria bacterium]|nr:glycosyltransferase family 39 protein [Candidatus Harrisonbacteria bacterium]